MMHLIWKQCLCKLTFVHTIAYRDYLPTRGKVNNKAIWSIGVPVPKMIEFYEYDRYSLY